jgi:RNA methyltransferase, TrmH family
MKEICLTGYTRNIIKAAAKLQQKKFRLQQKMLLIEGLLPLQEAVRGAYRIREIFYKPAVLEKPGVQALFVSIQEKQQTPCYEVEERELRELSTEVTPQGIVATAEQKTFSESDLQGNLLLLDRIQDPGNAGTLFRIAHWFGLGGLLLMPGTVEAYNPKVIRGSMGSVFHVPFLDCERIPETLLRDRTLMLSKVHEGSDIRDLPAGAGSPFILAVGNEAGGLGTDWDALPHLDLTMPAPGTAESLNAAVAAAVMLSKLIY